MSEKLETETTNVELDIVSALWFSFLLFGHSLKCFQTESWPKILQPIDRFSFCVDRE